MEHFVLHDVISLLGGGGGGGGGTNTCIQNY